MVCLTQGTLALGLGVDDYERPAEGEEAKEICCD